MLATKAISFNVAGAWRSREQGSNRKRTLATDGSNHPKEQRTTTERCEFCRFWPVSSYNDGEREDGFAGIRGPQMDGSVSDCRRYAPRERQPTPDERMFGRSAWPTTRREDWCGEFQRREPTRRIPITGVLSGDEVQWLGGKLSGEVPTK